MRKTIYSFMIGLILTTCIPARTIAVEKSMSNQMPIDDLTSDPITETSSDESTDSSSSDESKESSQTEETSGTTESSTTGETSTTENNASSSQEINEANDTTETSSEVSVDVEPQVDSRTVGDSGTGLGTEASPFYVGNLTDLTTALKLNIVEGETAVHIRLVANLNCGARININRNTVIDGLKNDGDAYSFENYYTINYTGGGAGVGIFRAGAANINVTFKNLNFGSAGNSKGTYYGIFHIPAGTPNVVQNMENINYYATVGAQPFCSYTNSSILNISGTNKFNSSGGSYAGEFVEGYAQINFKEGSNSDIEQLSTLIPHFINSYDRSSNAVSVEENAKVSINTAKRNFFNSNGSLDVKKGGQFRVRFTGSATKRLSSVGLTINFGENSVGEFINESNQSFDAGNSTINADNPEHVLFARTQQGSQVINDGTITFRRIDASEGSYQINYISSDSATVNNFVQGILAGESNSVNDKTPPNAQSIIYQRGASINPNAAIATPTAEYRIAKEGGPVSQIEMAIQEKDYTPTDRRLQKVEYKIFKTPPYSGEDPTADAAQNSISNETGLAEQSMEVTYDSNGNMLLTPYLLADLLAGNYYVYARITDQVEAFGSNSNIKYTTTSPWAERKVNVATFIELVEMPNLDFSNGFGGNRLSLDALDQNILRVATNAYLNVEWQELIQKDSGGIRLLSEVTLPNVNKEPELKLTYNVASDYTKATWDFASSDHKAIRVAPYFESATAGDIKFTLAQESLFSDIDAQKKSLQYLLRLSFNQVKDV